MWVAFAMQKLLTFFSAKNIRILCIESTKTVNEMTLNELVDALNNWAQNFSHVEMSKYTFTQHGMSLHMQV